MTLRCCEGGKRAPCGTHMKADEGAKYARLAHVRQLRAGYLVGEDMGGIVRTLGALDGGNIVIRRIFRTSRTLWVEGCERLCNEYGRRS